MQTKKTLTKLRLINWHYFSNETILLKNINLFSGENGAGKSTVLDAIQLILTTNSRKFNLAANNESKRTLKSYVRGKTGEEGNEYLRKGAVISYIALEIYEEAKQKYFVLGAKFDSPDLEGDIKRKWFCEEGTLDQLSFITDNKPSKDEQFRNNGKKVTFIQQTTAAKDRFRHRMGHLQENFFELLSRSMAFKPMKDIKSFVSQFILPEKNIDIDALRENIRNLKEMQLLFEEVQKQATALETIRQTYDNILHIEEQILVIDILLKIAEAESNKENQAGKEKQIAQEKQKKAQNEIDAQTTQIDIESLEERNNNVQIALNSGEKALLLSSIQSEIDRKKRDRAKLADDIKKLKEHLNRIRLAKRLLGTNLPDYGNDLRVLEADSMDVQDRIDLVIDLENRFQIAAQDMQEQLSDAVAREKVLSEALSRLSIEINDLKHNRITYDQNVIALKEAIEREFRTRGIASEVRIFADLLEISDSKWQNAVEGYLNTQRFHIIVEPQYYDIAADVYDRNKAKIHTTAVVNTAKLKTDLQAAENTLASIVQSENLYAHAYICYLLGRVTMCHSVSQLKEHAIAITEGCMLYQGNALRKMNPKTYRMPYIGKYALAQQLKLKEAEYEEKSKEKSELETRIEGYEDVLNALRKCNFEMLKEVLHAPALLKKVAEELIQLEEKRKELQNDPGYLQMQMDAEDIKNQLAKKRKELQDIQNKINRSEFLIEQFSSELQDLKEAHHALEKDIDALSRGNEYSVSEAWKKYEEYKKGNSADTIAANYQRRRAALMTKKSKAATNLTIQQSNYKNGELGSGVEMMPSYAEEYEILIKHDLISYEEKLRVIKENCETEFRENFLAKIRENIEKAISLFKELNKTLKPIYYGNDSYRFDWTPDNKKKRLYDMIVSDFNLGGFNLFTTQFDAEYHDEMNELFSKLTASDEQGDDVIREYTDYRSYLDYDIDIVSRDGRTQKFSKIYREKSGGETQTPYYVAIAASFVQLYSMGETIRVIMLDEAFDKMDEERIENMLNFFKLQNLQVILAVPTSRLEIIGEQADNIIMIYTDGQHNSFSEEFTYDEL